MWRRTVLLRVKVREQNGQGTRIPWCRCRMCARRFVSYPYSRSQNGHLSFFPEIPSETLESKQKTSKKIRVNIDFRTHWHRVGKCWVLHPFLSGQWLTVSYAKSFESDHFSTYRWTFRGAPNSVTQESSIPSFFEMERSSRVAKFLTSLQWLDFFCSKWFVTPTFWYAREYPLQQLTTRLPKQNSHE